MADERERDAERFKVNGCRAGGGGAVKYKRGRDDQEKHGLFFIHFLNRFAGPHPRAGRPTEGGKVSRGGPVRGCEHACVRA